MHLYREYKIAIKQIADLQELAGSGDKEIAELARRKRRIEFADKRARRGIENSFAAERPQ